MVSSCGACKLKRQGGKRCLHLGGQGFQAVTYLICQATHLIGLHLLGRQLLHAHQPIRIQRQLLLPVPGQHLRQVGLGLAALRGGQVQVRVNPSEHQRLRGIVVAGDHQAASAQAGCQAQSQAPAQPPPNPATLTDNLIRRRNQVHGTRGCGGDGGGQRHPHEKQYA
jgi:hypothetical protein